MSLVMKQTWPMPAGLWKTRQKLTLVDIEKQIVSLLRGPS
jgi:hypothetical protein